jgi:hypothetical protein
VLACRKGYGRRSKLSVSKHDATRAEYDRFGGVGISRGRGNQNPSKVLLPERPIHVLLMRAKCLRLGARSAFSPCFQIPTRGARPYCSDTTIVPVCSARLQPQAVPRLAAVENSVGFLVSWILVPCARVSIGIVERGIGKRGEAISDTPAADIGATRQTGSGLRKTRPGFEPRRRAEVAAV